jgi:hypothetical protein
MIRHRAMLRPKPELLRKMVILQMASESIVMSSFRYCSFSHSSVFLFTSTVLTDEQLGA